MLGRPASGTAGASCVVRAARARLPWPGVGAVVQGDAQAVQLGGQVRAHGGVGRVGVDAAQLVGVPLEVEALPLRGIGLGLVVVDQLVPGGAHAVVGVDVVGRVAVHEVAVVHAGAPVGRGGSGEQGAEGAPLH